MMSEKELDKVIKKLQNVFVYLTDNQDAQVIVTGAIETVLQENYIMQIGLTRMDKIRPGG